MQGSHSLVHRVLAHHANTSQHLADGGPVGFGGRGLSGLRDLIPKMAAMGYQQTATAPAPPPAADQRNAQLQAMIPRVEAMGYKQQPQHLARGGVVRGPGTGTSDSIETEAEPGTFIMPADSTKAIGAGALEKLGTVPVKLSNGEFEFPPEQVMALGAAMLKLLKDTTHTPVNGVDGGQTDAEVGEGMEDGAEEGMMGYSPADRMAQMPPMMFADGGLVDNNITRVGNSYSGGNVGGGVSINGQAPGGTVSTSSWTSPAPAPAPAPAPTIVATNTVAPAAPAASPAPAPAAPMGWAERNAQRSNEVTASSIMDSPERRRAESALAPALTPAPAPQAPGYPPAAQRLGTLPGAGYQPRRYADGGMVQDDRAVFGFYPQLTDHGKTSRATADKLQQGVQATGAASFQPAAPAAEPPPLSATTRLNSLTDPRSLEFAGTREPAVQTPAPQGNGALSRAATMMELPAPAPSGTVTRTGNSYTGPANITGDVTINGSAPNSGGYVGAPNAEAAMGLTRRGSADAMALMPNAPPPVQAPTIRNSTNDWAARNNLRNLEVGASSITNQERWGGAGAKSADRQAYQQALATDAALQQAQPGMDLAAMRERGDTQRAGLQVAAQAAEGAANRQNDWSRTVLKEQGDYARTGLQADAMTEAARTKAAAAGQKPSTEAERLSSGYAQRMIESTKFIDRFEKDGKAGVLSEAARGLPVVGGLAQRIAMTKEQQQYRQGQEDWVRAKLRKESGAVIGDGEMQREIETYFPMPGDTPEVIQQKRASRSVAIDAMKANAGAALPEQYRQQQTAALPSGMSRQVGTSGGKPVYEDAQGNRFIGG